MRWLALLLFGMVAAMADEPTLLFNGKTLEGWQITGFGGHGEVEVQDGGLLLNQGILTGVTYTNALPTTDYEVSLEARRVLGNDFFCGLTFPVGDTFCSWIVGGWGGATVGLSSIDGEDAGHNATTSYHKFEKGRWYRLKLRVTLSNITAWIDDEKVIDADIKGKKIGLRAGEIELSKPFGIASWSTTSELRSVTLRKLEAPGTKPAGAGVPPLPESLAGNLNKLVVAATNTTAAWDRLAEMCDRFGPRLSGSTNLELALDWILAEMKAEGLEEVRGEPVQVPRWVRGSESLALVSPQPEPWPVLGLGGTIATPPGGITAPVLVVTNYQELSNRVAEAKGKIVVFNAVFTQYGETVRFRGTGATEASKAGAAASLVRSITPYSLRTPHTGAMYYDTNVAAIPHAAIAPEDADRLARWQARGIAPVLHLQLSGTNTGMAPSRNVVAEIRGREKPEEVVVMGGHIDSWDVGRGALDDGGGCLAAWEALRLIKQAGLRPRRTIRCVLWTNEENGSKGAQAYREAHLSELTNCVAAIESDTGALKPLGFGFTGSTAAGIQVRQVMEFLGSSLEAGRFKLGGVDADTQPLLQEGVPVFSLQTANEKYFWFHHTDADTPERLDPRELSKCAAALAVLSYWLADSEIRLPR
ncbi:MAG TPA: M20/M25/M40 family metallo-hydrolase [Candidatus Limnocylindria bacterium]|jgi:carboxypeptidase Q|nr:M20/M25/M40 family metallo-hydrolase [Candidatus Limnocylindria bacterium]